MLTISTVAPSARTSVAPVAGLAAALDVEQVDVERDPARRGVEHARPRFAGVGVLAEEGVGHVVVSIFAPPCDGQAKAEMSWNSASAFECTFSRGVIDGFLPFVAMALLKRRRQMVRCFDFLGSGAEELFYMNKLLERAVEKVQALPSEMQDQAARFLLAYAGDEEPILSLAPDEEADLMEAQAEMRRGEFATEAEIEAVFAKFRL